MCTQFLNSNGSAGFSSVDGTHDQKLLGDHHCRQSESVHEKKIHSRGMCPAVRDRAGGFEDSGALGPPKKIWVLLLLCPQVVMILIQEIPPDIN